MEAVRDRILLLSCLMLAGCAMNQTTGLDRANELVASYGRHVGVSGAELDGDKDRSFGSCGFHYDEGRDVLLGRAFVARAMIKTANEEGQDNYRRMQKALNDPTVGGMFEHGGAVFVLDEKKEAYFLVKEFQLATTTAAALRAEMDEMQNLAATWTVRWFARVAKIMHGHERAPTTPVTRKNDPG